MASGLRKLTANGRLESIGALAGDARSLSAPGIMTIFESRRGQIWVGTHGGGANVLDPATGLYPPTPLRWFHTGRDQRGQRQCNRRRPAGQSVVRTDGGGLDLARPMAPSSRSTGTTRPTLRVCLPIRSTR